MIDLLNIFQFILYLLFLLGSIYLFIFAVAGLFYKPINYSNKNKQNKFVVLIPGYKEDDVIVDVARKALEQDYPKDYFDIIVIADSLKKSTIDKLKGLSIKVIEVQFDNSSKAKSLNKAMEIIPDEYEGVIVLDADNIMGQDFISKMNQAFNDGNIAIQGHRVAKNLNTHFAVLDALSEEINNHIFRRGHRVLGLSAALIGSGMAFDYQIYKNLMKNIESFGEDKELELKLLEKGILIQYLDNALVYDEKITKSNAFVTQRTRWIANQLNYATMHLGDGITKLIQGNIDFFDKIVQHLIPPRILLLGFLSIIVLFSLIFNSLIWIYAWCFQWLLCVLTLWISVPKRLLTLKTIIALFYLPLGFFLMIVSLTRISYARRGFAHTSHSYTEKNKNNY